LTYKLVTVAVITIALVIRLIFAFEHPSGGGDWDIYATVAQNILNGCGVSLSTPGGLECTPHFGGNQLPGFPAFVAAIWWLTNYSDMAVRVTQTLCYVAGLAWLMRAVLALTKASHFSILVGLILAISPLQVAWPRFMQTETLALATNIWVSAELLFSLAEKRVRIIPLGLSLIAAIFTRLDGVLLCAPSVLVFFLIYRPNQAFRKIILLGLIVVFPLAIWAARNVTVGLPVMPQGMVLPKNAPTPHGYIEWCRTWMTEEYQRPGAMYPVNRMIYSGIVIDDRAYDNLEEKNEVELWLDELKQYDSQPFPHDIDARFSRLAEERAARSYYRAYISNNVRRALALWSNPFSSFAWPNELPGNFGHQARLEVARSGISGVLTLAASLPFEATTKALTAAYRYILIGMTLIAFFYAARGHLNEVTRQVILLVTVAVIARTLFFALTNNVETRYTVELVPWMELAVLFALRGQRSQV
jgi:hypothetical protein